MMFKPKHTVYSIIKHLENGLRDGSIDLRVRESAAGGLGRIGEYHAGYAGMGFPELLKDIKVYTREGVVKVLGKIGSGRFVPVLIKALRDEDEKVRESAALALGSIGEPAVPALIEVLKDEDERVRESAAGVLRGIGTPEALEVVEEYERRNNSG